MLVALEIDGEENGIEVLCWGRAIPTEAEDLL